MPQHLRTWLDSHVRRRWRIRLNRHTHGKSRRIEIVSKIKADRTNRGFVANAASYRHRSVIEIAGLQLRNEAGIAVRLRELVDTVDHVRGRRPDVAYIVKQDAAEIVAHKRQGEGRRAQLKVVDEQRFATQGLSRVCIAGSGLVDAKAAMRSCTSGEEPFRQGNEAGR